MTKTDKPDGINSGIASSSQNIASSAKHRKASFLKPLTPSKEKQSGKYFEKEGFQLKYLEEQFILHGGKWSTKVIKQIC
jgi:hypothetical protein